MATKNTKAATKKVGAQRLDGKTGELTETKEDGSVAVVAPPAPPKVKPSLRGKSVIEEPVGYVWYKAEEMFLSARNAGTEAPKRKDVVNACIADGVAPYTARTQYQLFYKHTDGGKRLMGDGNPRIVKKAKAVAPAVEVESTDDE